MLKSLFMTIMLFSLLFSNLLFLSSTLASFQGKRKGNNIIDTQQSIFNYFQYIDDNVKYWIDKGNGGDEYEDYEDLYEDYEDENANFIKDSSSKKHKESITKRIRGYFKGGKETEKV